MLYELFFLALVSIASAEPESNRTEKFICNMFSEDCHLIVIHSESVDISAFESENPKLFNVEKVVETFKCNSNNNASLLDCVTLSEQEEAIYQANTQAKLYKVTLNALLIGYANLTWTSNNLTEQKQIIITEPSRFIDKFFMIYVRLFSVVLSFVMGLLLEKRQLTEIAMKPATPLIGFFCQFGLMPLVKSELD